MLAADKKTFFGVLHALIEKSQDVQLLRAIMRIVVHWIKSDGQPAERGNIEKDINPTDSSHQDMLLAHMILNDDDDELRPSREDLMLLNETSGLQQIAPGPALTSKEKCNFLLRMIRFEKFPDIQLQSSFLDLVLLVSLRTSSRKEGRKC